MARKKFSFKSAGTLVSSRELSEPTIVAQPIGIKTPLEFTLGRNNEDFYKMHFKPEDQIKDNFRNLILTNFGERLGRASLGANLKDLLYDMTDLESLEAEAVRRITISAGKYIPVIQIKDINIRFLGLNSQQKNNNQSVSNRSIAGNSSGLSSMIIFVKYAIPRIGSDNQAIEVLLNVGG